MEIKFSRRDEIPGGLALARGVWHVLIDGARAGTVKRCDDGWEFRTRGAHATGRTRVAAVEAYYAAKRVHRYGDPCKTCGQPAYDYNTPLCADCRRSEEHNGTDALSRLYTPGKAALLAEIRAGSESASQVPQETPSEEIEPGDTVTAELTIGHGESARIYPITGVVFTDCEGTLRIRDRAVKAYPWAQSYEALTAAQDALLGPSVLSVEVEEARENRRAYDEIARSKAGETCVHCGHTVMFVDETECWFGRDSGYDCPDAPAGFYGIRSHDV